MRTFIITMLLAANCHAGNVKLTWTMSPYDSNGNPVVLTKFRIFHGSGPVNMTNIIDLGNPIPTPWKIDGNGVGTYSKTLSNAAWNPGQQVCFAIMAFSGSMESPVSNIICRTMNTNPQTPTLIELVEP